MGMLLIMLSSAALTESSQGNARGASAARITATALRGATIRARTGQVAAPQEAQSGSAQGMKATAVPAQASASSTMGSEKAALGKAGEPMMQAKVVVPEAQQEAIPVAKEKQAPPLPPKRARMVPVAPAPVVEPQAEQPAPREDTSGSLFARHMSYFFGE